jgi:predicted Ser/Thr protein kinase
MKSTRIEYLDNNFKICNPKSIIPKYVKKTVNDRIIKQYNLLEKEIYWLNKLKNFDRSPTIIKTDDKSITMTYCGTKVNKVNIPKDWKLQMEYMLKQLNNFNVSHNDIKNDEILVLGNKLHLIDFQHATHGRDEFNKLLKLGKVTQTVKIDDRTVMTQILTKLAGV